MKTALHISICISIAICISNKTYCQTIRWNPKKPLQVTVEPPKPPKLPEIKRPRIVIGGNPFEPITDAVQKTIDGTGKLIPEEVKKVSTKLFGESAKLSGDLIDIYRDNQNKITSLTLQGLDLYQQISDPVTENVLKLKSGTLNAVGVTLPKEIDKALDDYISLNKNGFNELYSLYNKTLEIEEQILDGTSTGLKEFGKYLLLTTNGFPKMATATPLNKQFGIATLNVDPNLLQSILDQLIKNEYRTASDHSKPFQVISISSGTLKFDNKTNSFILELNDSKIRHNQPTGFSRISATLNIKKLKLQILPSDNQNGSITFKTKLYYLDVEDLLPKLDEMLCWIFEENITSKISATFKVSELINSKLKIEKSNIDFLKLSTSHFTNKIFISENQMGIIYKSNDDNYSDTTTLNNSIEVKFNEEFIKSILNTSLNEKNGVKISIEKKAEKFDETRNHIFLKKINNIKFNEDGSMYIGTESSVHFRRFLGKKPKVNVLFSNVGFKLIPTLSSDSTENSSISMTLIPVIDSLTVTGNPVKSRILRKVAKLFKASRTPIELDKVEVDSIRNFNFVNPLNSESILLPKDRELKLSKGTDNWKLILEFK